MKDTLYHSGEPVKPFAFDRRVAEVFPDMINRSVPGYPLTLSMIGVMADEYIRDNSNVYDLGCALGAVGKAIQGSVSNRKFNIIAVDNSAAMLDACRENFPEPDAGITIKFRHEDILDTKLVNASMAVLNFTLQFIRTEYRSELLQKIYAGLLPGGIIILSEKIFIEDEVESATMNKLHHRMKLLNGYNELEIAGKRQALEDVLVSETTDTHLQRLARAGFNNACVWLRCFNFVSIVAMK